MTAGDDRSQFHVPARDIPVPSSISRARRPCAQPAVVDRLDYLAPRRRRGMAGVHAQGTKPCS